MRITSIVLDLDDTLYLERDYVRSGMVSVGAFVTNRIGVANFTDVVTGLWDEGHRRNLFDTALMQLGLSPSPCLIQELIDVYRSHRPQISLLNDAIDLLEGKGDRRIALITDGFASAQRNKIEALDLARFGFDPIIATGELGEGFSKPHCRAFEMVMERHGAEPTAMVYVADNPAKDFLAPKALGWRTIQIDRPDAVHPRTPPDAAHAAELHISTLDELDAALDQLSNARP